jgi:hypothetical protein
MEFKNLTPFDALAFVAVDIADNKYHVVAMRVGYDLQPLKTTDAKQPQHTGQTHQLVLAEEPATLAMEDIYYGQPNTSSVKWESDLAPFKPHCDVVVVNAHAHGPDGKTWASFTCGVQVGDKLKELRITGKRQWTKRLYWQLDRPETTQSVPIRYELAYGGSSQHTFKKGLFQAQADAPINEVYPLNPVGMGWAHPDYLKAVVPSELPCAQIEDPNDRISKFGHAYTPQGFGVIGRAWAQRIPLAGTYDDAWLRDHWPKLPQDFDFGYWNGAHPDLQIPYPKPDVNIELIRLSPSGRIATQLPAHRGFVLARFEEGAVLPLPTVIDTLIIDMQSMQVHVVYRALVRVDMNLRVLEARFELDPKAPLVKRESKQAQSEREQSKQGAAP